MADDFNKVNYDRVFKEKPAFNPLEKVSSIGSRIGAIFFGVMFGGIALVMAIFLLFSSYQDIVKSCTYNKVQAAVTLVDGSLEDSEITIHWSFYIDGKEYAGEYTADESGDKKLYEQFSKYELGQSIEIMYNPADPTKNERYKPFDPTTLFMLLFIAPFIITGFLITTGKLKQNNSVQPGTKEFPAVITILMLFLLCCPAAFVFAFLGSKAPASTSIPLFIAYIILISFVIKVVRRKINKKRKANVEQDEFSADQDKTAAAEDETADTQETDGEAYAQAPQKRSFFKEVGFQLLFTVGWCSIVGVFIGVCGYQIYRYAYAKEVFASTTGKVLSSHVESHTGEDSTTYSPEIKYAYHVNGKKYIGTKYELSSSSSSGGWADRVVSEHPEGKKVTVYYNPSNPSDAVLMMAIPSFAKICILFLQPFIAVGIFMLYWTIASAAAYFTSPRAETDFSQFQFTSRNLWGRPQVGSDSLTIVAKNKPNVFISFLAGYGGSTFAMIFIAAFMYDFDLTLGQTFMALKIAAGVGVLSTIISIVNCVFAKPEIFSLDKVTNSASLESKKDNWQFPLKDIRSLRIRETISSIHQNNKPLKNYLLEAVAPDGKTYPVHLFKGGMRPERQLYIAARRAGEMLASFIGCGMEEKLVVDDRSKEVPEIVKRMAKFMGKMN